MFEKLKAHLASFAAYLGVTHDHPSVTAAEQFLDFAAQAETKQQEEVKAAIAFLEALDYTVTKATEAPVVAIPAEATQAIA